jgi:hypothetical protein
LCGAGNPACRRPFRPPFSIRDEFLASSAPRVAEDEAQESRAEARGPLWGWLKPAPLPWSAERREWPKSRGERSSPEQARARPTAQSQVVPPNTRFYPVPCRRHKSRKCANNYGEIGIAVTDLPFICGNPSRMSGLSSCCSATAGSVPRCGARRRSRSPWFSATWLSATWLSATWLVSATDPLPVAIVQDIVTGAEG